MEFVSEAVAFRRYVREKIAAAQRRLNGEIETDMTSYGHAVALTKFAGLIESIAETVATYLGRRRSRSRMIRAARDVHAIVDRQIAKDMRQTACRAGCFFCCFQPVEANLPEILQIADHLLAHATSDELAALRQRMAHHQESIRLRPESHPLCPLNVDGRCMVYQQRPLTCRGYNALDARACEAAYHEGRPVAIQYVGAPVAISRGADMALQVATNYHFPDERVSGFRLVPALAYALDHPRESNEKALDQAVSSLEAAANVSNRDVHRLHSGNGSLTDRYG